MLYQNFGLPRACAHTKSVALKILDFHTQSTKSNMSQTGDHEMADAAAGAEIDAPARPERQRLRLVRRICIPTLRN